MSTDVKETAERISTERPSRLAMEIAVHMEVHAALSTTTEAKAREIDTLLAKEVLIITPPAARQSDAQEGEEVELRAAAQNVYAKLASETAVVTLLDQERLGDAIRAITPRKETVGVKGLADAKKRMQEVLDLHDSEVADQLASEGERADLWTDIDVLVDDLRVILSALDLSPAEGQHNAAWLQGFEKSQAAAPSNPVISDEMVAQELCATEGCGGVATERFEGAGVGSIYCPSCVAKIAALSVKPQSGENE